MRDACSRNNGFQLSGKSMTARSRHLVTFRLGRLAPSGSHRDHGTTSPYASNPGLPDQFRDPDLQYRRRSSLNERAPFAVSPCPADETTCDQTFPATAFL